MATGGFSFASLPTPEPMHSRAARYSHSRISPLSAQVSDRPFTSGSTPKTILNAVIDPLVVLDDDLQVQTANRAFYDWFGASREQTQGVPLADLGDDDWKASGLWSSLKATLCEDREFQTIELERDFPTERAPHRPARCSPRWFVTAHALVLLSFRDITKRKQRRAGAARK